MDSYRAAVYQCMGLLGVMNKSSALPVSTIAAGAAMSLWIYDFAFLESAGSDLRIWYSYLPFQVSDRRSWRKLKDIDRKPSRNQKTPKEVSTDNPRAHLYQPEEASPSSQEQSGLVYDS